MGTAWLALFSPSFANSGGGLRCYPWPLSTTEEVRCGMYLHKLAQRLSGHLAEIVCLIPLQVVAASARREAPCATAFCGSRVVFGLNPVPQGDAECYTRAVDRAILTASRGVVAKDTPSEFP